VAGNIILQILKGELQRKAITAKEVAIENSRKAKTFIRKLNKLLTYIGITRIILY